jgi:hypothetical protein
VSGVALIVGATIGGGGGGVRGPLQGMQMVVGRSLVVPMRLGLEGNRVSGEWRREIRGVAMVAIEGVVIVVMVRSEVVWTVGEGRVVVRLQRPVGVDGSVMRQEDVVGWWVGVWDGVVGVEGDRFRRERVVRLLMEVEDVGVGMAVEGASAVRVPNEGRVGGKDAMTRGVRSP